MKIRLFSLCILTAVMGLMAGQMWASGKASKGGLTGWPAEKKRMIDEGLANYKNATSSGYKKAALLNFISEVPGFLKVIPTNERSKYNSYVETARKLLAENKESLNEVEYQFSENDIKDAEKLVPPPLPPLPAKKEAKTPPPLPPLPAKKAVKVEAEEVVVAAPGGLAIGAVKGKVLTELPEMRGSSNTGRSVHNSVVKSIEDEKTLSDVGSKRRLFDFMMNNLSIYKDRDDIAPFVRAEIPSLISAVRALLQERLSQNIINQDKFYEYKWILDSIERKYSS